DIRARAEAISKAAGKPPELLVGVVHGESLIGGGTAPTASLPTFLIAVTHKELNADQILKRLRRHSTPIIGRIEDGRVLLDLRTVFLEQDSSIIAALQSI